jgi:hypothetical protein
MSEQNTAVAPIKREFKLPTPAELFSDNAELAGKSEELNFLLATKPPDKWVKKHPVIDNYFYLPIDKVEFLLRKIFKKYNIEVLREGTAFNGVFVVVRVHYLNPGTGEMDWHDGIGACQLQTKKGTSPADLANINHGAISMAFPIAKTVAIKDACDHFGELFGCNLNRKDTIPFQVDGDLLEKKEIERYAKALENESN